MKADQMTDDEIRLSFLVWRKLCKMDTRFTIEPFFETTDDADHPNFPAITFGTQLCLDGVPVAWDKN